MEIFGVSLAVEKFLPPKRELPSKQKELLLEAILECRTASSREGRNAIVNILDSNIRSKIHRSDVAEFDMLNIFDTYLEKEGGFQNLINSIAFFEKKTIAMKLLNRLLFRLFGGVKHIKPETYEELVERMDTVKMSVDNKALIDMYGKSILLPIDESAFADFETADKDEIPDVIVAKLLQLPEQDDGRLPLFTFVDLLIGTVLEQTVKDKLVAWREKAAKETGIEGKSAPVSSHEASWHLLIKFEPHKNKPEDTFYIQAWFIGKREEESEIRFQKNKSEAYSLNERTDFFDELIRECEKHTYQFDIELFVPITLLNHVHCDIHNGYCDIHQWHYSVGFENSIQLIHQYPFVLRSYERAYETEPRVMQAWRTNWHIYKESQNGNTRTFTHGNGKTVLKEKYYFEKRQTMIVQLQSLPYLEMAFVPPRVDSQQVRHIFRDMLSAGISVALWPRTLYEGLDEDTMEQEYHTLSLDNFFSEPPKYILDYRKRDADNAKSFLNILTLFYDDPDILPPELLKRTMQPEPFAAPKKG